MNIQLEKYRSASDEEISKVEAELQVRFPSDYREFVSKYDAATPEENVFDNDVNVSVDRFIPISEIGTRALRIDGFPQDALPIAEAPSGNFIYFQKGDFSVWFWDHEIESGDKELATSFDGFMQKLVRFNIDSIQLQPGQVKSVWVDPDFKPEF